VNGRLDVLIIGGDGLIGRTLARHLLAEGLKIAATSRRGSAAEYPVISLDLAKPFETDELPKAGCVLIAAAVTSVAACQANPTETEIVNVEAPRQLARWAMTCGARPLLLSSAAVLDGTRAMALEDSPPRPTSVYGHQKAAAEAALLQAGGGVLRLGKVLHPAQATIAGWRSDLRSQRAIRPLTDLRMAPVSLELAVLTIARLILADKNAVGIFQITAKRDISYAEAAAHFASVLGASRELVIPTTSEEAGIALIDRPRHATLSDARTHAVTGIAAPPPENAITESAGTGTGT
jgi:dTDP-4-dehydrorhamnose reductase